MLSKSAKIQPSREDTSALPGNTGNDQWSPSQRLDTGPTVLSDFMGVQQPSKEDLYALLDSFFGRVD